jgi:Tol biopolymer transport system component
MIDKTLGHYRVGEQLGRGGMGEVYLADDLNLNRKVALKFLPEAFAADPERMARFEREAKLLASLNHPNIAAIYGLEQAEGKRFLVLELVEGETLAQRLSKGSLPLEEALGVCRQIADALEAAHEKGVIHRDLKPANVMITEGDKVKILDFGLAKALSDETQSVDSSQTVTITDAMTRPGVILGTAAYMSPEQAKGMAVDKRADIWAFGCVLYECLTGDRVFEGKTVTDALAAILKGEPDWQALPAATPPNIRFVLRRCLEKEISRRFRDAADVRIQIEEARDIGEATVRTKRPWPAWGIAVLFLLTTAVLAPIAYEHLREEAPAAAEPMRFQITPPAGLDPAATFALSPDGRHLAFPTAGSDGVIRLWIRALDSLEARPLPGTESPHIPPFFWSPDSRFIAFDAGGKLKKVDIIGGLAQTICDLSGIAIGGSWNRDGVIIFGSYGNVGEGVKRVSAAGGTSSPLARPDPARHVLDQQYPTFLPDGRHFLYYQQSDIPESNGVFIGSLGSRPEEQGAKRLLATTGGHVYIPSQESGPGQILFMREQTLMAQRFDDKRLELVGEPVPVAEQVGSQGSFGFFSASTNGVLVYRSGGHEQYSQAMWFDRQGKGLGGAEEPGVQLYGLALSPDGTRAAVSLYRVGQAVSNDDIWLLDFARHTNMRFTFGQGNNRLPVWSPDGSQIIFASNRDGGDNLYQKAASGVKNEELLLKSSYDKFATSWSSEGRFLLYTASDPKTKYDLWVLPMEGDRKPMPFLRTEFNESDGHFSPDMRWIAYVSDESGNNEIYVRRFSQGSGASLETGSKWVVSQGGGVAPRWRRNGKELYYLAPDRKVMVVEIAADTVFHSGTPKPLFPAPLNPGRLSAPLPLSWDVTSDGNRFLFPTPAVERTPAPFTVVLNWQSGLKK